MRAVVASVVGVVLAAGLGAAGYVAIANTTDGDVVGGGTPEISFPSTPTATLAVLDDAGNLASLAVLTVRPDDDGDEGGGGTIVPIPTSADSSGGFGGERTPLNETVALFGPETMDDEVPLLLGVGIDELARCRRSRPRRRAGADRGDRSRVARSSDGPVRAAGRRRRSSDDESRTGGRRAQRERPVGVGADRYPVDVAVWKAIADAVGAGLTTPLHSSGEPPTSSVAGAGGPVGRRPHTRHVRTDLGAATALVADRQPRPQPPRSRRCRP